MQTKVFAVALAMAALALTGRAEVIVQGVLEAGPEAFAIDSAMFQSGPDFEWFVTTGWQPAPMGQDTFTFPEFAAWPDMVMLTMTVQGAPFQNPFPAPLRDEWYTFDPPNEITRVKFRDVTGIKAERPEAELKGLLSVTPTLVTRCAMISARVADPTGTRLEIVNAVGARVRTLPLSGSGPVAVRWSADDDAGRPLPEGSYFCRLVSPSRTATTRLVLTR